MYEILKCIAPDKGIRKVAVPGNECAKALLICIGVHSFLKRPINGIWTLLLLWRWIFCWEKSLNRFAGLFVGKANGFAPFVHGTKKTHIFFR